MKKISILTSGTWGTALANLMAYQGHDIILWSSFASECEELKRTLHHPHLDCSLSPDIVFTNDISLACKDRDIIIFATPSLYLRNVANIAKPFIEDKTVLVTVTKGIEKDTLFFMDEVLVDVIGEQFDVVALSGPTHAEEVAIGLPTLIVSACKNKAHRKLIQETMSNDVLRVYTNEDIRGVELCGALKNIVALAAGISEGLGFGDNAKAAIITRGLVEITRLGKAMGCDERTFSGLAGIGDIVVTATSNHSRNHNAGVLLGKGYSLEETLAKVGMVVEGINALEAAKQLEEKYCVQLPIIDTVYDVVYNGLPSSEMLPKLFSRRLVKEYY